MSSIHQYRPITAALIRRSMPNFEMDRIAESRQRENDALFVRKLHEALWAGDNIPAGQPKPVRPLILVG